MKLIIAVMCVYKRDYDRHIKRKIERNGKDNYLMVRIGDKPTGYTVKSIEITTEAQDMYSDCLDFWNTYGEFRDRRFESTPKGEF